MMMPRANLVPARRRAAQQRRARLKMWAWAGGVYGLAVAGVYAYFASVSAVDQARVNREVEDITGQVELAGAEVKELRGKLASVARVLASQNEVTGHPDWSDLLTMLSTLKGESLVLESCELGPAAATEGVASASGPMVTRPSKYTLRLTGLGRDQRSITRFAVDLEKSKLFSKVKLKDSTMRTGGAAAFAAFDVECTLDEVTGGAP